MFQGDPHKPFGRAPRPLDYSPEERRRRGLPPVVARCDGCGNGFVWVRAPAPVPCPYADCTGTLRPVEPD
jgi:hypothetical protein